MRPKDTIKLLLVLYHPNHSQNIGDIIMYSKIQVNTGEPR